MPGRVRPARLTHRCPVAHSRGLSTASDTEPDRFSVFFGIFLGLRETKAYDEIGIAKLRCQALPVPHGATWDHQSASPWHRRFYHPESTYPDTGHPGTPLLDADDHALGRMGKGGGMGDGRKDFFISYAGSDRASRNGPADAPFLIPRRASQHRIHWR
jgi:hypothetical protein